MLVWPMAAKAPSAIDSTEMKMMICCHWWNASGNGTTMARRTSAKARPSAAVARNAVIGVGAPS